MSIDAALKLLPPDCRFHVGHTPHWYSQESIPKHLRKRPFEAYVCRGRIATQSWIFESADGATPAQALSVAITQAIAAIEKQRLRELEPKAPLPASRYMPAAAIVDAAKTADFAAAINAEAK